ncbi:MAG: prolyl oligopeptidase family serine peptidase [Alphaproteobacteria bacterium]|nr:prolyl oligopeptidase family serine peptidase [Alphaproteobacteria bacterium]
MGRLTGGVLAAALAAFVGTAHAGEPAPYEEIFYASGKLRIQAYLYKPAGEGRFPVIVYNHGSRATQEHELRPSEYIGRAFTTAGYVVLVTERRGYGRSDGPTQLEEIGNEQGPRLIARLRAEADDVIAALDFLRTQPFVDTRRAAVMGWSLGGIVTMLTIARTDAFKAAVDQAGGALDWNRSAAVRQALEDAAAQAQAPVLLLDAANDATTDSITHLDRVLADRNLPHEAKIYPPFVPQRRGWVGAPGHAIFGPEGLPIWRADVLTFLDRYTAAPK